MESNRPRNLISPPAAITDSSFALVWDGFKNQDDSHKYQIFINGALHDEVNQTDYTVTGLENDQVYEIYVCRMLTSGEISEKSNMIKVRTKKKGTLINVIDFGAVGDGQTMNTLAIQSAIDACPKGGVVYIPEGTFLTGALFLKSELTLYLNQSATLLGSENLIDYPILKYRYEGMEQLGYASLINTKEANGIRNKNISIIGSGTINASGTALRRQVIEEGNYAPGRAICIKDTDYLYLYGFTVRHSPAWCVHLIYCNHVSVNQINIHSKWDEFGNPYGMPNGDGLNPDSTSDVYIFNSMISSQDDCIAIKSGRDTEGRLIGIPSERIRIFNCKFKSGFGVALGSEMSGNIRDILIRDCTFENCFSVASVKAPRGRGGVVEDVLYENITFINHSLDHQDCRWFRGAIYVDQYYSHADFDDSVMEVFGEGTAIIRNLRFCNIQLDTLSTTVVYLVGLPESPLRDIELKNIRGIGKQGIKISNVQGLRMENVAISTYLEEEVKARKK